MHNHHDKPMFSDAPEYMTFMHSPLGDDGEFKLLTTRKLTMADIEFMIQFLAVYAQTLPKEHVALKKTKKPAFKRIKEQSSLPNL